MGWFEYRNGVLYAESVSLVRIAEEIGTPVYCYSNAALKANYKEFADAFGHRDVLIAYSVKANANQAVITTLSDCGAGADVVSGGRTPACFGGRHSGYEDRFFRCREDSRRAGGRARRPGASI